MISSPVIVSIELFRVIQHVIIVLPALLILQYFITRGYPHEHLLRFLLLFGFDELVRMPSKGQFSVGPGNFLGVRVPKISGDCLDASTLLKCQFNLVTPSKS